MEKWYTVKEAMATLKVSEGTVHNWRKSGIFPNAKRNGKWLIPQRDIDAHLGNVVKEFETEDEEMVQLEKDLAKKRIKKALFQEDRELSEEERLRDLPEILAQREAAVGEKEETNEAWHDRLQSKAEGLTDAKTSLDDREAVLKKEKKTFDANCQIVAEYTANLQKEAGRLGGVIGNRSGNVRNVAKENTAFLQDAFGEFNELVNKWMNTERDKKDTVLKEVKAWWDTKGQEWCKLMTTNDRLTADITYTWPALPSHLKGEEVDEK